MFRHAEIEIGQVPRQSVFVIAHGDAGVLDHEFVEPRNKAAALVARHIFENLRQLLSRIGLLLHIGQSFRFLRFLVLDKKIQLALARAHQLQRRRLDDDTDGAYAAKEQRRAGKPYLRALDSEGVRLLTALGNFQVGKIQHERALQVGPCEHHIVEVHRKLLFLVRQGLGHVVPRPRYADRPLGKLPHEQSECDRGEHRANHHDIERDEQCTVTGFSGAV